MAKHTQDPHACHEYRQLSRRSFMARTTASAIALATPAWLPRVTFAQSANSARDVIVSIFLRGGADGLTLVAPFGDPAYYGLRPTIAIPQPDSTNVNRGVNLDGFFCLPNAMSSLLPAYQAGHLLIVHATGSTDPTRSHFDAQNYMEVGVPGADDLSTGWLGRHLASRPPTKANASLRAVGFSFGMPLTLAGAPDTLPIPDPGNFGLSGSSTTKTTRLNWLANAYASERDPLKSAALNTQRTIATLTGLNIAGYVPAGGAVYPTGTFAAALRSTAALIRADIGVEAVQIDISGWDTHSAQGPLTGGMATNMRTFATSLAAFHQDLAGAGPLEPGDTGGDLGVRTRGQGERQPGHRPWPWQLHVRDRRQHQRWARDGELAWAQPGAAVSEPGSRYYDRPPRHPGGDRVAASRQQQHRSRVPRLHAIVSRRCSLMRSEGYLRQPVIRLGRNRV